MATLPRTKHGAVIASPFCNSPRKLQEMTFPSYDGHDVTAASGMSMRHYEEQLNGLKKENFHLKLRIYFLEEKLGTGSPPAVQGLLEHNVRLQVEVEELRRQLTDKQELLAAAAEAIDVLEQQGSISTDSVEASIDHTTITVTRENDKTNIQNEQTCDETCPESESAGDYLGTSVDVEGMNEISRLRREHRKALQMIKGCVKKIQQQDGEIKKLKLNKELAYAQVSDQQLEKYEEIVKCKDAHIRDLEIKVKDLQMNADNIQDDNSGNLQELLTKRLQGLAYFLDKLLSHKCVLGEDKQKLAESILEQSLALPVGLQLDESMAPDELAAESSLAELSQSLRLEDLTLMLGHHQHAARRAPRDSDSECWSEPDRRVSLARIGLPEQPPAARARRARLSAAPTAATAATATAAADEELEAARQLIDELQVEKNALNELLAAERATVIQSNAAAANDRQALLVVEADLKEAQRHLEAARALAERLRSEKRELEASFAETEQSLRRAADEATVQASEAALERARAQHERLRVLRELDDARDQLTAARDHNIQLQAEIAQRMAIDVRNKSVLLHDALPSEEDRPTSPDQGIDSDRLSSLEQTDAVTLSPRSLYEENVNLKQKLARTKATLADTLAQLNAANMRKRNVQRAICREIHKTQGVLRKARDQLENQN